MTDTTPPNKQPLFIAFAPGYDLAATFAIAVEDDRAATGGATIARKNTPRVVETVERCRPDAEQRARVLIGDLTAELLCLAAETELSALVGGGDSATCGALPAHDGTQRGFVFFGFCDPGLHRRAPGAPPRSFRHVQVDDAE